MLLSQQLWQTTLIIRAWWTNLTKQFHLTKLFQCENSEKREKLEENRVLRFEFTKFNFEPLKESRSLDLNLSCPSWYRQNELPLAHNWPTQCFTTWNVRMFSRFSWRPWMWLRSDFATSTVELFNVCIAFQLGSLSIVAPRSWTPIDSKLFVIQTKSDSFDL